MNVRINGFDCEKDIRNECKIKRINKTDIFYSLYDSKNSDFYNIKYMMPNYTSPIICIDWIETDLLYRYMGLGKSAIKEFCDNNSASNIIIAEIGYLYNRDKLYSLSANKYPFNRDTKDLFSKQIYYLESLGFKDTGIINDSYRGIFIYQSELAKPILMTMIQCDHGLY